MKEGKVYSPKGLHDDAKAIADAYGTGGYVDLVVLPEGSPAGEGRIDVHYKIEEGDRSFVQRINIIGNTRTKDKVIRREVLVAPGDVFNTVRVDITKKRLDNLGYFAKVETYPEDTGVPGRKDLTVQVEEKRTGSLSFGGGFSTVDSTGGLRRTDPGQLRHHQLARLDRRWPEVPRPRPGRNAAQGFYSRPDRALFPRPALFARRPGVLHRSRLSQRRVTISGTTVSPSRCASRSCRLMYGTLGYRAGEHRDLQCRLRRFRPNQGGTGDAPATAKSWRSLVFDRRDNPVLSRKGTRITFRLTWPAAFSAATFRFMAGTWKLPNISICRAT